MKTFTTLATLALACGCALPAVHGQDEGVESVKTSSRWTVRGLFEFALEELIEFEHGESVDYEGLTLARKAVELARKGQTDDAINTLKTARVSWPEAPQLPHMIADLYDAQGNADEALNWYSVASSLGKSFRADYHSGQICYERAEAAMEEAGVPADAAAFPTQPPPELVEAVTAGQSELVRAREHFLDALLERRDERASESVSAITKRIDELQKMLDKIEQPENDENEDENEENDEQNEDQDQDQEQDQDGDGEGDPQDDSGQPNDDEQEPPEDDEGEQQEQDGPPPSTEPVTKDDLTPEQIQRLEDKLEELEELAARLDALARQRERDPGERDW